MNVWNKFKLYLNSQLVLYDTLALTLCTLFIGYAPSSISLALFIVLTFRWGFLNGIKPRFSFSIALPMILYLLFLASLFWTEDIESTRKGVLRTISLILVPISFAVMPKWKEEGVLRIFNLYTISNFLLALLFIFTACFKYLKTENDDFFFYHELVSILDLHAIYVSLAFLISFLLVLSKKDKTSLDFIQLITFFLIIFLLSSKAMITLLAFSILSYALVVGLGFKTKSNLFVGLFVFSIIALIASSTFIERASIEKKTKIEEIFTQKSFGLAYNWTGTSIRLFQLRLLKEQIEEGEIGILGYGLFASRNDIKERHKKYNTYPGYHDYNYHNQYAQILAELGILGLCVFLLMLLISFKNAIFSKSMLSFAIIFAFSISFFTEVFLWRQRGLFLFIIFYCFLSKFNESKKENLEKAISESRLFY